MNLNLSISSTQLQATPTTAYLFPGCLINWSTPQAYEANTWVQLIKLPSSYSFDQALLLCQHSEDEWLVWIPDHGEAILHESQFCY